MTSRSRKAIVWGIALVLAVSFGTPAAFAAPNHSIKATLTVYDWENQEDVVIAAAAHARFNKVYPNVKIVTQAQSGFTGWAEYINRLLAMIASGNTPDVALMAIEGTRQLVSKNVMLPLDERMANDTTAKELISDVSPTLFDPLRIDGKTFIFPTLYNTIPIFYNTKLFKAAGLQPPNAGWTTEDFRNAAIKLTKGSGDTKVYGFDMDMYSIFLNMWPYSFGTSTLTADWSGSNLNDPKVLEAYQFLHDLVYKDGAMPVPEVNSSASNLFAAGRVAMVPGGHNSIVQFNNVGFKDWDVAIMPHKVKGSKTEIYGVAGFGILKASKNPDLGWEFIKEMAGPETMKAVAAAGTNCPVRRSVAMSASFLKFPPNARIFYDSLSDAKPLPAPINDSEFEEILSRHYLEFMSNKTPVADSLAVAHKELQASFDALK